MDLEDYINNLSEDSSSLIDNENVVENLKKYIEQLAKQLKDDIQYFIDLYYNEYSPTIYKRSYGLQRALEISDFVNVSTDARSLTINLDFDDSVSWGNSIFSDSQGYKPILIDQGWQVNDSVWFSKIKHFGYQSGAHFIENGIDKFKNEINDSDVRVLLNEEEV